MELELHQREAGFGRHAERLGLPMAVTRADALTDLCLAAMPLGLEALKEAISVREGRNPVEKGKRPCRLTHKSEKW